MFLSDAIIVIKVEDGEVTGEVSTSHHALQVIGHEIILAARKICKEKLIEVAGDE